MAGCRRPASAARSLPSRLLRNPLDLLKTTSQKPLKAFVELLVRTSAAVSVLETLGLRSRGCPASFRQASQSQAVGHFGEVFRSPEGESISEI
jgi:hypothetical protein